jgi:hypothetical protein
LVPPPHRELELAHDYAKMESMFLEKPPAFQNVLQTIRQAEESINRNKM